MNLLVIFVGSEWVQRALFVVSDRCSSINGGGELSTPAFRIPLGFVYDERRRRKKIGGTGKMGESGDN